MEARLRKQAVHAVRVGILVCIALLMRSQQNATLVTAVTTDLDIKLVRSFFPAASSLQPTPTDGRIDVLDELGRRLGNVVQTSPDSDHIIGFSGPTNVLIAFSPSERILGMNIVSSGDTRDHVRQVREDQRFMESLNTLTAEETSQLDYDAVSGATLTSLAIREAIAHRLGQSEAESLRFPDPPNLDFVRSLFPTIGACERLPGTSVFNISDGQGNELGSVLRTSPAADNAIGYQGPTEALIGFDSQGKVIGVSIGKSYDNEPYVTYVREDTYFLNLFNELDLNGLADFDLIEHEVEGVSGATMTSMAVAEGILLATKARKKQLEDASNRHGSGLRGIASAHDLGTVLVIMVGMAIGLTRLRGNQLLGFVWKIVLIGYLGLIAGNLISQAMLVGWAGHGVPIRSAIGLVCLAIAALSIPVVTRRNLYCTHLCPHGAAQQLIKRRLAWQVRLPRKLRVALALIPALLLLWCLIVGMSSLTFSLVDIEPFDAYVFRVAGWATIAVAVIGLAASLVIPMAYCRYGCPTGVLLEFLRFNAKADRWTIRDWVATGYLLTALALRIW